MKECKAREFVQKILDPSDVQIDGNRPWDVQIHNPNFYERVISEGSLALGESYIELNRSGEQ